MKYYHSVLYVIIIIIAVSCSSNTRLVSDEELKAEIYELINSSKTPV